MYLLIRNLITLQEKGKHNLLFYFGKETLRADSVCVGLVRCRPNLKDSGPWDLLPCFIAMFVIVRFEAVTVVFVRFQV